MKIEPTRVREGGTLVTLPKTPEERIAAIRGVVDRGQYAKVDGMMVDLFSASAIVAVYDKINAENQRRFASLPVHKMAKIAFQLV